MFIRRVATGPREFVLTTLAEFLAAHPTQQVVSPNPSSWGARGFSEVWLNEMNAWIYPQLYSATRRMPELARRHRDTNDPHVERALRQIARELLLAQASDWPFLIKTNTAPHYAKRRVEEHLRRFSELDAHLRAGEIDSEFLRQYEERTTLFPNLNWRHFL
jgi:1,4-alpha-glucan branching enzyme